MKKFTSELKIGLLIVAAILIALFFWIKTANFTTKTYKLRTYFVQPNGIKENSTVLLSGIEVGRVESVKFLYDPETKVELVLLLDKEAKAREDSIAFIGSTGLIGEASIGITAGAAKNFLKDGDAIISEEPIEMRLLMKRANEISSNLNSILEDVKTLVSDNKEKVDHIVTNLESTSANFDEFSKDLRAHPWKLLFKGKEKKPAKSKKKS